jgi:hypothetical protein
MNENRRKEDFGMGSNPPRNKRGKPYKPVYRLLSLNAAVKKITYYGKKM